MKTGAADDALIKRAVEAGAKAPANDTPPRPHRNHHHHQAARASRRHLANADCRHTKGPATGSRKRPIRRAPTVPEATLLHALADVLADRPELYETPNPERPRPERTTR